MVLNALGLSKEKNIDSDLEKIESKKIQSVIETIVLFSSELQMILSDISFMLRFITEAKSDPVYNRRFLETRNEIIHRDLPAKLQPIISNLDQIKEIAFSEIIARDVLNRIRNFLNFYNGIMSYNKVANPEKKWLIDAAESARSLQRGTAQLEHQLLVFYLKQKHQ